jgi:hypothetical protein
MDARLLPITFQPQASRQLRLLLLCLQGLTFIVLILAPLTLLWRVVLILSVLVLSVLAQRRFDTTSGRRITQVRIDDQHSARLCYADGRRLETRLRQDSLVIPWLIVLRFDGESVLRRQTLLLGWDSLADEEMRRLRILLRFGRLNRSS